MIASLDAQDQIAALLADAMPERILSFKFSDAIQERIQSLTDRKKIGTMTASEQEELDKYLLYDLLIGLAKARAVKSERLK
jgi:hypothetical protein